MAQWVIALNFASQVHVWNLLSIWSPDASQPYGYCRPIVGGMDFIWNPEKLLSQLHLFKNFPSCFLCISGPWCQWDTVVSPSIHVCMAFKWLKPSLQGPVQWVSPMLVNLWGFAFWVYLGKVGPPGSTKRCTTTSAKFKNTMLKELLQPGFYFTAVSRWVGPQRLYVGALFMLYESQRKG